MQRLQIFRLFFFFISFLRNFSRPLWFRSVWYRFHTPFRSVPFGSVSVYVRCPVPFGSVPHFLLFRFRWSVVPVASVSSILVVLFRRAKKKAAWGRWQRRRGSNAVYTAVLTVHRHADMPAAEVNMCAATLQARSTDISQPSERHYKAVKHAPSEKRLPLRRESKHVACCGTG